MDEIQDSEIIKFINEIDILCQKYGMSISHEDIHGAFIIEKYDNENIQWLKYGIDKTK